MTETDLIRTPDQRVRVFVSSALRELATERRAVRDAIAGLRLVPVMFELGARPHPPRNVYRAYLAQSQIFVGIYWQSYGWVSPGERVSGLEDEYLLAAGIAAAHLRQVPGAGAGATADGDGHGSRTAVTSPTSTSRIRRSCRPWCRTICRVAERALRPGTSGRWRTAADIGPSLPAATTPLVGREREVETASELVLGEGVHLVTLTGPGGVGTARAGDRRPATPPVRRWRALRGPRPARWPTWWRRPSPPGWG
jgi:hypothetical protein